MSRAVKFLRERDDIKGAERAFLDADTASHAHLFGDDRSSVIADCNGLISCPYTRAVDYTFFAAFLGMTSVFMNNSYTQNHDDLSEFTVSNYCFKIYRIRICFIEIYRQNIVLFTCGSESQQDGP